MVQYKTFSKHNFYLVTVSKSGISMNWTNFLTVIYLES